MQRCCLPRLPPPVTRPRRVRRRLQHGPLLTLRKRTVAEAAPVPPSPPPPQQQQQQSNSTQRASDTDARRDSVHRPRSPSPRTDRAGAGVAAVASARPVYVVPRGSREFSHADHAGQKPSIHTSSSLPRPSASAVATPQPRLHAGHSGVATVSAPADRPNDVRGSEPLSSSSSSPPLRRDEPGVRGGGGTPHTRTSDAALFKPPHSSAGPTPSSYVPHAVTSATTRGLEEERARRDRLRHSTTLTPAVVAGTGHGPAHLRSSPLTHPHGLHRHAQSSSAQEGSRFSNSLMSRDSALVTSSSPSSSSRDFAVEVLGVIEALDRRVSGALQRHSRSPARPSQSPHH